MVGKADWFLWQFGKRSQPIRRSTIHGNQAIGTGKSHQAGGGGRSELVNLLHDVMDGIVCDIDGNNLVIGNSQDWPDQFVNCSPNVAVFSLETAHCKATKIPQKTPSTIAPYPFQ